MRLLQSSSVCGMQPFSSLRFELFECAQADLQVLADPLPIELASHAGELDLSVQRPVRNAEQCAVGYAEAEAVGGDGRRFHVQRNGAGPRQAAAGRRVTAE